MIYMFHLERRDRIDIILNDGNLYIYEDKDTRFECVWEEFKNETLKQNSRDASTMLGQISKQSCMILHDLFMLQIEERLSSLLCPSSYWHINSNELFF